MKFDLPAQEAPPIRLVFTAPHESGMRRNVRRFARRALVVALALVALAVFFGILNSVLPEGLDPFSF